VVNKQAAKSTRPTKTFTLANGLKVMLVHNPKAVLSAAALNVAAGSYQEPGAYPGLAHFLEHMLFLGTEKYPKVGDYQLFIDKNGGSFNAATGVENTTYYFDVVDDAFAKAFDQFAHFFIAPTFNPKYVAREKNAVESEFINGRQHNGRREYHLSKLVACKDHVACRFSTGNSHTLRGVTREILISFYEKYYSADRMTLVIISKLPLAKQERFARALFSQVKRRKSAVVPVARQPLDASVMPAFVQIKPVGPRQKLDLYFQTPSPYQYWRLSPLGILGHVIGHEGQGSLHSVLKKEGLATSVSAGGRSQSMQGEFIVSMNLTAKGETDPKRVIEIFFAYFNLMKKQWEARGTFDELKKMAAIEFRFREPLEGGTKAQSLALDMRYYPGKDILRERSLLHVFSAKDLHTFFDAITPANMRAFYISPKSVTDKVEKIYNIKYSIRKMSDAEQKQFASATPLPGMHLPVTNPYIPSDVELVKGGQGTPEKVIDDARGVVWLMKDSEVHLPKGNLQLTLRTPAVMKSTRAKVLSFLYVRAFNVAHSEFLYLPKMAGLMFNVGSSREGIGISISGFTNKQSVLLAQISKRLRSLPLTPGEFDDVKNQALRDFGSFRFASALKQAANQMSELLNPDGLTLDELLSTLPTITLPELRRHAAHLFDVWSMEGVAYGNYKTQSVEKSLGQVFSILGGTRLPREKWHHDRSLQLAAGKRVYMTVARKVRNFGWLSDFQIGPRTFKTLALAQLLSNHLSGRFYNTMRTEKQLGYVVGAYPRRTDNALWMRFFIQSPRSNPQNSEKLVDAWLPTYLSRLKNLSLEDLKKYKKGLIAPNKAALVTMGEWAAYLYHAGIRLGGVWDYRAQRIKAIEAVTKEDLITFATNLFGSKTPRITVGVAPAGKKVTPLKSTKIRSRQRFQKQNTTRFPRRIDQKTK
ncbi:insulinase family protein, partial [Myxococcota bacterium]|nr:insulinase family protein [Myxococcota bacterium]